MSSLRFSPICIITAGLWLNAGHVRADCPSAAACPSGTGASVKGTWGCLVQPILTFDPNIQDTRVQPFPMHAILLKNGKILILPTEPSFGTFKLRLLDPARVDPFPSSATCPNTSLDLNTSVLSDEFDIPTFLVGGQPKSHVIPCSGQVALRDGKVLFVGGESNTPGERSYATLLDPDPDKLDLANWPHVTCNDCWIKQDNMPSSAPGIVDNDRYYPTLTVLGDGRVLVMGGSSDGNGCPIASHAHANTPMIFDGSKPFGQQWSTLNDGQTCPGQGFGACTQCLNYIDNGGLTPEDAAGVPCVTHSDFDAQHYPQCFQPVQTWNGTDPSYFRHGCATQPATCNLTDPDRVFHLHYYPHMFLLSDGTTVHTGSTAGPWSDWHPKTRIFNPTSTGSWTIMQYSGQDIDDPLPVILGMSVMYQPNVIMKAGGDGIVPNNTNSGERSNAVYKLDMSASSPHWEQIAPMCHGRHGINLVTLPDGKVMATNGYDNDLDSDPVAQGDVLSPEIYEPAQNVWCQMKEMTPRSARLGTNQQLGADVRAGHSEALLLPDARVLVMGGELDGNSTTSNNNAQIFSPPYLFAPDGNPAIRPVIYSVGPVPDTLHYGVASQLDRPLEEYPPVDAVSLIKLGASTHNFDQDQRYIPLTSSYVVTEVGISLEIDPPANPNEAPPGYYMLFVLKSGVPSEARIVKLEWAPPVSVWITDVLSPDRTTRSLRFRVQTLAGATVSPGPSAIKVTMVDLQHPNPPNLAAQPPPNLTTYDTRLNGVCVGGSRAGHHCDTTADCTSPGTCTGGLAACTADPACADPLKCTLPSNGCARWVGKLGTFYESQGPPPSGPYKAARLQCTPYYWDWTAEGLITVVGADVAPSSEYSVQVYGASCMGAEAGCTAVSAPVTMYTRRSGDVDQPYNPPSATGQPDVTDVSQLVNKFKMLSSAPVKARSQLQANLPELNANINVLDILAVVDALKGVKYAFSGPCACPSLVTCDPTACSSATPCVNAYGAGSTCVKTFSGGTNAGDPCIDNSHCPGGGACDKACASGSPNAGLPCNSMAMCNTCNGNSNYPCDDNGDCAVGTCSTFKCEVIVNTGFCRDRCGRCSP